MIREGAQEAILLKNRCSIAGGQATSLPHAEESKAYSPWWGRPVACQLLYRKSVLLFLLPIIVSAATPQAQIDPRPIRLPMVDGKGIRFTRISTADGLSQTRVAQIVQDDRGFMWFGTQYGLNRYDGYNFKVFVHDPRRPNSLGGAFISALFKDRSGVLWIGTNQFLDRFDPTTEAFTHYRVEPEHPEGLAGTVLHISQDRAGMLWLATGAGLHRFDPGSGKIKHYRHNPSETGGLSTNDVQWTGEDKAGTFWVGTSEGLDAFDRETGKVTLHVPLEEDVQISFYEDRFGVFWILHASGSGLAVLDRKTNRLTRYSFYERDPQGGALTGVMGMVEDREGNLWLGSPGVGLLRFDRGPRRFVRYRNNPGDLESLAEDKVIGLYADREGNIWTGLHSMGPNHFSPKPAMFEKFRREPGAANGLDADFVNAIYEDREGILWIGNDNALNRIDRRTGRHTSFNAGLGVKPMVITITEDRSGMLWVGTFGYGLNRFDRRTGRFKTYRHNPADPSSLSNDEVHRLLVDHAGTLWVATDDGLNRFDPATERFKVYKFDWQSRRSQSYIAMAEDQRGALWLGAHYSGLHRFDPATGRFTVYKADPNTPGTLSDNMATSVHMDRSGAIWVATQNGLNRLDPQTGKFTGYDSSDGLPGNAVSCILEDAQGALWMSTNKGLSRFDPLSKTFKNYSAADGLPGNDLTGWGSCFKSPSGEMFFAGFPGAIAFRPEKLADSSYVPSVVLTDFRLSGNPVVVGGGSPLSKSIAYTSRLTLSHEQPIFSLAFSALSYFNSASNRYRYRLEGLNETWREVGSNERLATYTTLPPGTYTFHLQGATSRGPWSEPGVKLEIEILPPMWKTAWFRTVSAALILIALYGLYRARLRQVANQFGMRLEERVAERTRIARELHDTLLQSFHGLILRFQAVQNMLPHRPVQAGQALETAIDRAAQAITEGRDAVQELRSSTTTSNDLVEAITALGEEMTANYVNTDSGKTPATFRVLVEGTPQHVHPILRDDLYRIAREAVGNAFRHARANVIEVELRYEARMLRLRVRDDGIGMDPHVLAQGGREGHWGLAGMRERTKIIGGQLEVWSELRAGTEIEVKIPGAIAYRSPTANPHDSATERVDRS